MAEPLDPVVRGRIIDLAKTGEFTRNALARQVGVAPSTVTRVTRDAGLTDVFDRTRTAVATRAAQVDHAAKRSVINTRVLEELSRALTRLGQPVTVRLVAGKDVVTFCDAQPSPRDLRDLSTAVAQLAVAHGRLAEIDARFAQEDKLDHARSVIGSFMESVKFQAALLRMSEDGLPVDQYLQDDDEQPTQPAAIEGPA